MTLKEKVDPIFRKVENVLVMGRYHKFKDLEENLYTIYDLCQYSSLDEEYKGEKEQKRFLEKVVYEARCCNLRIRKLKKLK